MKLAEILREVFGAMSRTIAEVRAEVLKTELRPGETMPDAELEHELYLRLLDRRIKHAKHTEQEYRGAAIRHKALSRDRNQATAELKQQLCGLRQIVDLALGKGSAAALLEIKGRTERRQDGISSQAGDVLIRLDELTPKDPVMAGVTNDPVVWKGMIEPAYRRLEDLRQLVLQYDKSLDGLLIAKSSAFALFDDTARGLVHIAEGQCRLIGRNDLAKRIRRFSRKRRRPGPKPKAKAKQGKKAKTKQGKKAKAKAKAAKTVAKMLKNAASARAA